MLLLLWGGVAWFANSTKSSANSFEQIQQTIEQGGTKQPDGSFVCENESKGITVITDREIVIQKTVDRFSAGPKKERKDGPNAIQGAIFTITTIYEDKADSDVAATFEIGSSNPFEREIKQAVKQKLLEISQKRDKMTSEQVLEEVSKNAEETCGSTPKPQSPSPLQGQQLVLRLSQQSRQNG